MGKRAWWPQDRIWSILIRSLIRKGAVWRGGAGCWKMGLEAPGPDLIDFDKELDKERGGLERGRGMLENGPGGPRPGSGRFR